MGKKEDVVNYNSSICDLIRIYGPFGLREREEE